MKISVIPKSRPGVWSAVLTLFAPLVFVFLFIFGEVLKVLSSDTLISACSWCALAAVVISAVFGIFALIRKKDRTAVVFLCVAIDAVFLFIMVMMMLNGE